jgi:hypothetical protein
MADYQTAINRILKVRLDNEHEIYKPMSKHLPELLDYHKQAWEHIRGDQIPSQAIATVILDAQIAKIGLSGAQIAKRLCGLEWKEETPFGLRELKMFQRGRYTVVQQFLDDFCLERIAAFTQYLTENYPQHRIKDTAIVDIIQYFLAFRDPSAGAS